jgi:23S rRNA (cytidine2498-2'-O)-methyltransferase
MTHAIFTCSPHFTDLALNEIRRQHPAVIPLTEIAAGKILLHTPTSYHQLTRPWQQKHPIYLHHCSPVENALRLDNDTDPIIALHQATRAIIPPNQALTIQTRIIDHPDADFPLTSDDINDALIHAIPEIERKNTCPDGKILSILLNYHHQTWWAYLGVSWANQNLSPFPSGFRPINIDLPNRAGYKLIEALETFDINLRADDHALDLGAAPGAWTIVLRQHGLHVTAVAPKAMYPFLQHDPMIDIFQGLAEDYIHQVDRQFDLITNDMILDAQDAARLMVDYAPFLRPQGIAIMTLKLRRKNRRRVMDHSLRLLRKAYKIIRIRQLVYNRNEVTLFLRRKD